MRQRWAWGALALLAAACGPLPEDVDLDPTASTEQEIINGEACSRDRMPTAVAILIDATIDFFGMQQTMRAPICTGTLIAPDVVIGAAHCFDSDAMTMGMGTVLNERYGMTFEADLVALAEDQEGTIDWPGDAIEAVAWHKHAEFTLDSMNQVSGPGDYKDIGIMFLSRPVTGVEPMLLITADEADQIVANASVDIAGWGQQTVTSGYEAPPAGTVGAKHCATSFINDIGDWEIQIGGDSSTSRKCHGDSGGPTYLEVETPHARKTRLIGITSHAYDESDCLKGGVDTRVDSWLGWIDQQMRDACSDGTRSWCEVPGIIPPSYYDPSENPDGGNDDDDDDTTGIEGCPCTAGPGAANPLAALPLMLLGLLAWRRRRV